MKELRSLRRLARLHGIQTDYWDNSQRLAHASPTALLRVLQAWGAPLGGIGDVQDALRQRRRELWRRAAPPAVVAWDGDGAVRVRLPRAASENGSPFRVACHLVCEDGDVREWTVNVPDLPVRRACCVEGVDYIERRLSLPPGLPLGYHRLLLSWPGGTAETLVISAPQRTYTPRQSRPSWGVFLPLYALHRESSWGGGDLSDLQELARWAAGQGAQFVATLPLLAWQYEINDDPSPYAPASRLFWNDFYVDVTRIPEFATCEAAKALVGSAEFQAELAVLRKEPIVDYPRQMRLKRQVLELLAEQFFSQSGGRRDDFADFRREHPDAEVFARFRALNERHGCWLTWPQPLRDCDPRQIGNLLHVQVDERIARLHLYVQWQVQRQLEALADDARANNLLWYLDFPLGVSRGGYDCWREKVFAMDANGGAPPDSFFTKGQNWGFPPLHPERLREQGYRYFIAALRHHLRCARLLRIDHVMGMHRLFWVPEGFDARDGAYVRYPAEELFAILALEAHRHQAQIVGENLGTVPPAVDRALDRHGIAGMYVQQFEMKPWRPPMREPPAATVASLNTHDLPTFKAFWTAAEVDDRLEMGLLTQQEADGERAGRAAVRDHVAGFLADTGLLPHFTHDSTAVYEALLTWLGTSSARFVLANLEDLWGETQPQNTPGTWQERCNWRRKARYSLEQFRNLPEVVSALYNLEQARRQAAVRPFVLPPPHYLPQGVAASRRS